MDHGDIAKRTPKREILIMSYQDFLNSKITLAEKHGFEVGRDDLHPKLKDFQKHAIQLALEKGKFALFEDCGLGKTFQQLEWANQVVKKTQKPVLILAPLGVSAQTVEEGNKWGIEIERDVNKDAGIYITNYEQIANISHITDHLSGIVLDESSILKNFTGKIKEQIISTFRNTPYKLPCTATPAPNDPMELGNHAEFLNVMSRLEMLAMYFNHDGGETSKWKLKGHAKDKFFKWISSWALMIEKPSDIGYSDDGYLMPELIKTEDIIETSLRSGLITNSGIRLSSIDHKRELRRTIDERMNRAAEFANERADEYKIIWTQLDDEGVKLRQLIPDAIEVKGSDPKEKKEELLLDFGKGKFKTLITKPKIAQYGLNYQHCGLQIFPSPDYSFEKDYQCIRRSLRFGREGKVRAHFISTDTMEGVRRSVITKSEKDQELKHQMRKIYKQAS